MLAGTSWLFAPSVNSLLSSRTTLISQYELPGMPYAWAFRLGDFLAASLLLTAVWSLKKRFNRPIWLLLFVLGVCMVADPLFTTTCHVQGNLCVEYISAGFWLHAVETVVGAGALFALSVLDAKKRRAPSILFACFQVLYGLLFVSQLAHAYRFTTLTQFIYQSLVIVWLAWFVGQEYKPADKTKTSKTSWLRKTFAVWAALNGLIAIAVSLARFNIFGFISGLYFANDTAWLAQHGVIVGLTFLYLSRHIARGEKRARQLFLIFTAIEALKYAAITPHPTLLGLYIISFGLLFLAEPAFRRGTAEPSWQERLLDTLTLVVGTFVAMIVAIFLIHHTPEVLRQHVSFLGRLDVDLPRAHLSRLLPQKLLSHTLTALEAAVLWFVLWSLFRPRFKTQGGSVAKDALLAKALLKQHGTSSEDYFKLWPADKTYFYNKNKTGFVAYKITGGVAFALPDPLADTPTAARKLSEEFLAYCHVQGLKACFLPVASSSETRYKKIGLSTIQIGSSAVIDVNKFVDVTARDKWWRWQTNRGQKAGYRYQLATPPHNEEMLGKLKVVSNAWLNDGHREQGFAMGYFDEAYLQACRLHLLYDQDNNLIAFANELPVFNNLPQTTVDLIRYLPGTQNAMQYLLLSTIKFLSQEGNYKYFDLGFVPLAQMQNRAARLARSIGQSRFSASGLEQFKNKFDPDWQPNYAAYDGDIADLAVVALSLEKAMAVKV